MRFRAYRSSLQVLISLALVPCWPAFSQELGVRGGFAARQAVGGRFSSSASGAPAAASRTVRSGESSLCDVRSESRIGYAKELRDHPGNWGWTPRLRVGGRGEDKNHALLHFDLPALPDGVRIRRATLHLFCDVGNRRPPENLLGQEPPSGPSREESLQRRIRSRLQRLRKLDLPLHAIRASSDDSLGWSEDEFTFTAKRPGVTWTEGGGNLLDVLSTEPVAVCDLEEEWKDLDAKGPYPETWVRFDVTAAARSWREDPGMNQGLVIPGRDLEDDLVFFSDDWPREDRRPFLEIELDGGRDWRPRGATEASAPAASDGEYGWVSAMREAHARWDGRAGTFAQYGDSITVTLAFWTPLLYGEYRGGPPAIQRALETARQVIHPPCWREWKGGEWGNTGSMTIDWCFDNIDGWQRKMNPEVAVILFGTNDAARGPHPPLYTERLSVVVDRCLADGTIPIVTTLPPRASQEANLHGYLVVQDLREAALAVARAKRVPCIDLYAEMVRRRPEDWNGAREKFAVYRGYDVPTLIARDGVHPSNPRKFQNDWSEEALRSSGYALRNYLTLKTWYDIHEKVLSAPPSSRASGPLRVHPENPRYFMDASGRAVLLVGSHTWNNLVDMGPSDPPPPFDFHGYLDWMEERDHNFIRLWTWELSRWDTSANGRHGKKETHYCAPLPFLRRGPGLALDGKPRFDVRRYDPEYFQRLRSRVKAARDRSIYVSVMLFEGWGLQFAPNAWEMHPFHPRNNVNGIDGDLDGDGKGVEIHTLKSPGITAIQEAYVRKVIDTVNDLDNVLFEISNENHPPSTEWQYHMIDFIHRCEKSMPKQHPVGMTFQYRAGQNRTLFESPAEWVSPNHEGGYRDNPPPAAGRKVVVTDTDHLWGIGGSAQWVWKSFLRGLNPIFMDPYDGLVLGQGADARWESIRQALGHARRLSERFELAEMKPRPELASSRYCLAREGVAYLVYLPGGGEVKVNLKKASSDLDLEWLDPASGKTIEKGEARGGVELTLRSPREGDVLLFIRARAKE